MKEVQRKEYRFTAMSVQKQNRFGKTETCWMGPKQALSFPYLVRGSFGSDRLPDYLCGGTRRRTTLERSRQKNGKMFHKYYVSVLSF